MTPISVFHELNSPNAMFHQDGLKLHAAMMAVIGQDSKVTVSFEKVNVLTTQFLNASFGKLITEKGLPFFEQNVTVTGTGHLSSFQTKLDWVIDNIKNNEDYRPILNAVLS